MTDDLINRFAYHPPKNPDVAEMHGMVRETLLEVAQWMDSNLPEGREKSLVFTKLEEAMMWANASIARNQN